MSSQDAEPDEPDEPQSTKDFWALMEKLGIEKSDEFPDGSGLAIIGAPPPPSE